MTQTDSSELNMKSGRSGLGCSLAAVALLVVVIAGALIGTPPLLAFLANGSSVDDQQTAGAAHGLLVEHRDRAIAQLNSYGWVDQEAGVVRVPIDRAITLLAAGELPVGAVVVAETPPAPSDTTEITDGVADLSDVNYTDHILPIFQEHCSKCHGDDEPEEGLVLTSFAGVMNGSNYGSVIKPNDVAGSYLIELVESGEMPQRGDDLSPEEISTIIAWVEAGAPERGSSDNSMAETVDITPETVSFQEDVLPLFLEYCSKCHGDDEPEQGLVLTSYADVMAGSDYGSVVKPNNVAGSYLVELVESGEMPQRGEDLTPAQVAIIIAWIDAGAPDN